MPIANVSGKWDGGNLILFDKATGTELIKFSTGSDGIELPGPLYVGGSTNRTKVDTDGTVRLQGNATTWQDMVGDVLGKRLNSTAGGVDYDWDDNAIVFATAGSIADAADRVQWNQQINHQFKVGTSVTFKPHFHWFQSDSTAFVLTLQYRLQRNNAAKTTSWTTITATAVTDDVFTYSSGILNQISRFDDITITCDVSDTLQFRMARTDSETGDMPVFFVDLHGEVDSFGSEDEIAKS